MVVVPSSSSSLSWSSSVGHSNTKLKIFDKRISRCVVLPARGISDGPILSLGNDVFQGLSCSVQATSEIYH